MGIDDDLQVGTVGHEHFIAVSAHRSETIKRPLTGGELVSVRIRTEDIPWLIAALSKELRLKDRKPSILRHRS